MTEIKLGAATRQVLLWREYGKLPPAEGTKTT